MNLIVNRQLDRAEKQVIYELTLKKRQSKKSTMTEQQLAARRQLARELMQERRDPTELLLHHHHLHHHHSNIYRSNTICHYNYPPSNNQQHQLDDQQSLGDEQASNASTVSACQHQQPASSPSVSISGCSFGRSDSSYSGSSQNSAQMIEDIMASGSQPQQQDQQQPESEELLLAKKKEANIKFNKNRIEHLNGELERRLHQYEYLVAREKALLGAYNVSLFTNEGVNNFHLHDETL